MKVSKQIIVAGLIFLLGISKAWPQLSSGFTIPQSVCQNELVTPSNTSQAAQHHKWEFCYGGLEQLPSFQNSILNNLVSAPDGMDLQHENGNWFGFVVSTNSHSLIRLDFGSDLSGIPNVVNLGNPSSVLLRPRDISILKHNGSWFGLVANYDQVSATSRMVRLDFGASLTNVPAAADLADLGGRLTQPFTVKWEVDNGQLIALIGDRSQRKILLVNFNSNPTQLPVLSTSYKDVLLPASGFFRDFDIVRAGDNWYGVAISENGAIQKLAFIGSLFTTPSVLILTGSLPAFSSPSNVVFVRDLDRYVALITEYAGSLVALNFGQSPDSFSPTYSNLGGGGLLANCRGLVTVKSGTQWVGFVNNTVSSQLNRVIFQGQCSASISSSALIEPTVSFSSGGMKVISLEVSDAVGEKKYFIDSLLVNQDPVPDFDFDYNCTGQLTSIYEGAVADAGVLSWAWNFDDPISGTNSSSLQNPTHQFSAAGSFDVQLTVTDNCNVSVGLVKTIDVNDASLVDLAINAELTVCSFNTVGFSPQSSFELSSIRETEWDFGDGNVSAGLAPTHRYRQDGILQVQVQAVVNECRKGALHQIEVKKGNDISFSFTGICESTPTEFSSLSVGEPITDIQWFFGDGFTSTDPNPLHTYGVGAHMAQLNITNTNGCTNVYNSPVTIYSIPQTNFSIPLPPFSCNGVSTPFSDLTPNPFDSNLATWSWDFNDGNSSTLRNPQHTYTNAGNYQVSLTATTNFGCSASFQKLITISSSPQADFTNSAPCVGVPVTFMEVSVGTTQSRQWQIESASFAIQNPVYIFNTSGNKTVSLSTTATNGCVAGVTKNILVPIVLTPDFSFTKNCVNQQTQFTDITTTAADPVTSRLWTFNGVGTGTNNPQVMSFAATGNYNVRLAVSTQAGCTYSTQKNVAILTSPQANFNATPSFGAPPLQVQFMNTSLNATSYLWNFNDAGNSTSTLPSPVFTFTELGDYQVTMTAQNVQGCFTSLSKTILAVIPHYDIALTQLELLPSGNSEVSPVIYIYNKGNVPVSNIPVRFDLSEGASIRAMVQNVIQPGTTLRYASTFTIPVTASLKYVCSEVEILDSTIDDNKVCLTMHQPIVVLAPYPNPVSGNSDIRLEWVADDQRTGDVILTNSLGQMIFGSRIESNAGFNSLRLPTIGLQAGMYFLKINIGNQNQSFRVVVAD